MLELFIANMTYVAWRLFVTGNIILLMQFILKKFINPKYSYYLAVIVVAQISFWYDYLVFGWYFA